MKLLAGKGTVLVLALLGLQQLTSGIPLGLSTPKAFGDLVRRIEPIILPKPVPRPFVPEPVAPKPVAPTEPPPRFGCRATGCGADPEELSPSSSPPRFGENSPATEPVASAPTQATLGTEDELVAMGLRAGTDIRASFDRFSKWFTDLKAKNTETPWVFFTKLGADGNEVGGPRLVPKFIDEFKAGKHRLEGDDPARPNDNIQQLGDVMTPADMPNQVGAAPRGHERYWYDMVASYGSARLAAARGGNLRVLMPKNEPDTPEGKFWTNFEAHELTKPGSNVQEIWRYNSAAFDDAPIRIWKQGDAPIGNPPKFDTPIEDELIDLDF